MLQAQQKNIALQYRLMTGVNMTQMHNYNIGHANKMGFEKAIRII